MPLVLANRVQETGTANTTVSFTLTGAVTGFQSFAVIGNTNTTYYSATDGSGNWEVGLGTYSTTGPTLTRTTVYASSNSNLAVTFSGVVSVFVTLPSGSAVYEDASGNASPLGTITSGTWNASTIGVAYGGTGVTTSSGANSVVLRDANQNITINRLNQGLQTTTASGGTTTLTVASEFNQALVGTGGHTFRLPDATTLSATTAFQFNNNATGTLTIQNNAGTAVGTVAPGGAAGIALLSNGTVGGTWDVHAYIPENVTWGTNALALGSTVISGGTWQGGTITPAYGGTGLTSFTTNGAVYATGTATLTSGTLPVIAGGTGAVATPTNGQLLIGNGTNYSVASLGTGTGISTTTGSGTLTINNTGVTSLAGTSPVTASASTGSVTVSLASGYGDTQNPYASKTANFVLAAPSGLAGVPTFRAIVAADIPTLNQNTTGSAGSVANAVTFNNGGTGDISGTTFNGSAARTISYNTIGAPSTGGANATGTWGISISGNAATATTASNVNNGTLTLAVSGTGLSGSQTFTANQASNATFTVTSNATNLNTASTIVARDASGNFSAGTITATLSGSATSAGSVSNSVTFNNGGAGGASGSTFNGSGALTVSYNTVGAPSTGGANATGTWGISISGNAATATTAVTANSLNTGNAYTGTSFTASDGTNGYFYANRAAITGQAGIQFRTAGSTNWFNFLDNNTNTLTWYQTNTNTSVMTLTQAGVLNVTGSITQGGSQVLTAGNYNSYAPTLTGTGASGTWGISISGNAATATTATSATNATNATNVAGLVQNSFTTYGNTATTTAKNGYYGLLLGNATSHLNLMADGSGNGGIYRESSGWTQYYSVSNNCTGFGGSATTSGYVVQANGGLYVTSQTYTNSALNNTWYAYNDNDRNAGSATYLPTAATRSVRFFFATAASTSTGGNYAGVFQFNPWDGTTSSTGDAAYQLAFGGTAANGSGLPQLNIRKGIDSTWNSWYTLLHSGNYTSYSPSLTGSGASGTWGISISGNAATATTASNVNNGTLTMNVSGVGLSGSQTFTANQAGAATFTVTSNATNANTGSTIVARDASGNFSAGTITATLSGNASTASNTSSISSAVGSSYTWTATQYFTGNGNTGSATNIGMQAYSTAGNGAIMAFHRSGAYAVNMGLDSDNVFRIGGWSAPANLLQMTMAGNLTMAGTIAANSDERLKKDWTDLADDFIEQVANVKAGTYTRIDSGERQVGSSAQDWQKLLPEVVSSANDGTLSLAYGNAALVAAVKLAQRVVEQEARINRLEALVAQLIGE